MMALVAESRLSPCSDHVGWAALVISRLDWEAEMAGELEELPQ